MDCLVCQDWSSTYVKGPSGLPEKGVDLLYQVAFKRVILLDAAGFSMRLHRRDACATAYYFFDGNLVLQNQKNAGPESRPSGMSDLTDGGEWCPG